MLTVALAGCRRRPVVRDRGDLAATGLNADDGHRRRVRRRGRRERRRLPRLRAARRGRHQRRGRPPRQLGDRGGLPRGLRRVPRPHRPGRLPGLLRRRPRRRARWPSAARGPRRPRRVVDADVDAAPGVAADVGAATALAGVVLLGRPATTTSSTRSPRWPPGSRSASPVADLRAASRRSPAPGGGWSSRARSPASASTTATPTTRPRSPATSQAARALAGRGAAWSSAFQPHLVSRTRIFGAAMGAALGAADEVVVLRRLPRPRGRRPGGHRRAGRRRRAAAGRAGRLRARPRRRRRPRWSRGPAPGDLVLTLGAGDVTEVGPQVLALLGGDVRSAPLVTASAPRPPTERRPGHPARRRGSPAGSGGGAGWPGAPRSSVVLVAGVVGGGV